MIVPLFKGIGEMTECKNYRRTRGFQIREEVSRSNLHTKPNWQESILEKVKDVCGLSGSGEGV